MLFAKYPRLEKARSRMFSEYPTSPPMPEYPGGIDEKHHLRMDMHQFPIKIQFPVIHKVQVLHKLFSLPTLAVFIWKNAKYYGTVYNFKFVPSCAS